MTKICYDDNTEHLKYTAMAGIKVKYTTMAGMKVRMCTQ